MTHREPELSRLSRSVVDAHHASAVLGASLVAVTCHLFRHHGRQAGADLEPLISLQREAVDAWADHVGVDRDEIAQALVSLTQAGVTASALSALDESLKSPAPVHVRGVSCFAIVNLGRQARRCIVCGFSMAPEP